MNKCCKSMIPIDYFKTHRQTYRNHWLRHAAIDLDKGCTCPKTLLSVMQVCRRCLFVTYTMAYDSLGAGDSLWMKYRLGHRQGAKIPIQDDPVVQAAPITEPLQSIAR